jgi:Predicted Rossmann fold nucleotide-binding protein involved in DNA uptake
MEEVISFEERASICALNRIFGFEPMVGKALVDTCGSATEVFNLGEEALRDLLDSRCCAKYQPLICQNAFESAAMELERIGRAGAEFITINDPGYPWLLRECPDPPLGLYFKGRSTPEAVFGERPAIAIVGTRGITSYRKEWCERIVEAMSCCKTNPLIISGLALGVDITAHKAALSCGLPTVGVMATGIDSVYPSSNRVIGERMACTEGCALITDYTPGTFPVKINFLRRNRIIAGICQATILIESRVKGGGMMTARLASSYERDVFALPGRMDDPASQGCNLLIRESIAESIGGMGEFMDRLGLGMKTLRRSEDYLNGVTSYYSERVKEEELDAITLVARTIKADRGLSMDELSARTSMPFSKILQLVSTLECDGFVEVDLLQHCSAVTRRF